MVKVDNMNLNIRKQKSKRGVFTVEFMVLIVIIVLALLAMQLYLKRSVNGRFRSAGDSFGQGRQYEPGVTRVTFN